ncbi:HNH endonuclease [Rhizobium mongolense]|uniref:HNH endonuclease n=1 Tax=Rhizobium TaxID=379 RepID=UPI0024B1362F|nr:HNH endonuclease [Rhizobium sp. CC1099]WFU88861.1 HNH endonuclease [Rhizobium sp. CC1099]
MITEAAIRRAFRRFEAGERPETYGTPKAWYVIDNRSGRLYPLKAIWALANDVPTRSFNTSTPIAELPRIGAGFQVIRSVSENDATNFQAAVRASASESSTARQKRLAKAPKRPVFYYQAVRAYVRNPDVVAEALFQAKGTCGSCGSKAPFERRCTPYLEVHHVKPLAEGGDDTLENAVALCPNCHREAHFG